MRICKSMIATLSIACLLLTSCAGQTEPEKTEEPTNSEISEQAMDSFLAKISEGNYTMDAPAYRKIYAVSKDLVWFDHVEDIYSDFAAMSVNNEVFQAYLEDDGMTDPVFLKEGTAIEAAGSKLPNGWLDESVSGGNIFNLFYNDPENPLTFVSYEDTVKESMVGFAGYSENAVRLMEEVYLVMDDVDPKTVHLKAVVNDDLVARTSYDDIDIVITLGEAQDNDEAEAWMKNPVYPEARTAWNDTDEFILNSVFLPGYGTDAVPFPPFASYAFALDQENYWIDDAVYMRDSHASEKDLADYIEVLRKEGFTEAKETDEDGNERTVYRKLLREAYHCWSSIALDYDNGINITAEKYYECPSYEGLAAVNEVIEPFGFTALPEAANISSVKAVNRADELAESWLYFFAYDENLYVDIDFQDREEMDSYLKAYEAALVDAGFIAAGADEEDNADHYESEDEFCSFRYQFMDDDTVTLLYRAQHYIPAEEAETMIHKLGFPEIDLNEPIACRDLTLFRKLRYGLDEKGYITVSQTYASVQEAEEFLNAYEAKLNAMGFDRVNPETVGSLKQTAIYNEEKGMLVGIDFFEQEDGALVNFDFEAE